MGAIGNQFMPTSRIAAHRQRFHVIVKFQTNFTVRRRPKPEPRRPVRQRLGAKRHAVTAHHARRLRPRAPVPHIVPGGIVELLTFGSWHRNTRELFDRVGKPPVAPGSSGMANEFRIIYGIRAASSMTEYADT
jgi:hypothetical protein